MRQKLKIKVCGNKFPDNYSAIDALDVDYLGFISYSKSMRSVEINKLVSSPKFSVLKAQKILVVVDPDKTELENSLSYFDGVQLHGNEPIETIQFIRETFPHLTIIKAIPVETEKDIKKCIDYVSYIDYFLFDAKGKNIGGNGITFDWNILEKYTLNIPYFLSGGLHIGEVENINNLSFEKLVGVDINSKFETDFAVKDTQLIQQFLTQIQ